MSAITGPLVFIISSSVESKFLTSSTRKPYIPKLFANITKSGKEDV